MNIYFPHIYRRITAGLGKALFYLIPLLLLLLISFNVKIISPYKNKEEKQLVFGENINILGIELEKSDSTNEKDFWQDIIKNYPEYHFAYLKLADLYFKSGDRNNGGKMLDKYKEATILTLTPLP